MSKSEGSALETTAPRYVYVIPENEEAYYLEYVKDIQYFRPMRYDLDTSEAEMRSRYSQNGRFMVKLIYFEGNMIIFTNNSLYCDGLFSIPKSVIACMVVVNSGKISTTLRNILVFAANSRDITYIVQFRLEVGTENEMWEQIQRFNTEFSDKYREYEIAKTLADRPDDETTTDSFDHEEDEESPPAASFGEGGCSSAQVSTSKERNHPELRDEYAMIERFKGKKRPNCQDFVDTVYRQYYPRLQKPRIVQKRCLGTVIAHFTEQEAPIGRRGIFKEITQILKSYRKKLPNR